MARKKGIMGVSSQAFMITCETFGCMNKGRYVVGNTGAKHTCFSLCEDCKNELAEALGANQSPTEEAEPIEKHEDFFVKVEKEPTKEETVGLMLLEKLKHDGKITKVDLFEIAEMFNIEVDQKASNQDILEAIVGESND